MLGAVSLTTLERLHHVHAVAQAAWRSGWRPGGPPRACCACCDGTGHLPRRSGGGQGGGGCGAGACVGWQPRVAAISFRTALFAHLGCLWCLQTARVSSRLLRLPQQVALILAGAYLSFYLANAPLAVSGARRDIQRHGVAQAALLTGRQGARL